MISVVITTHGIGRDLPGILDSLENQRQYRTGVSTKGTPYMYEAGDYFSQKPFEVIVSVDGPYSGIEVYPYVDRWIETTKANPSCCGHNTREPGLMSATKEWVVLTNSDNLFFHGWYHSLVQQLRPGVGIVYWDIVSNLWRWQAKTSRLLWGQIDLSCVCVRTDIAKQVGFEWRNYDGDWNYIEECHRLARSMQLRAIHIDECLSVHN